MEPTHATPDGGLVFALALGAGMLGQMVARHARLPSIVFLLALGVILGPDVLGWVRPEALGDGLLTIVSLAVAVILFEGGLGLDRDRLMRAQRAIRLLITLGAAVTALGGALIAHYVMDWSWSHAVLFGTLVIVTGPTVIRPILRNVPLRTRLATVVEAEGVLIDPVGAIAAAVALEVVLVPAASEVAFGLPQMAARLGFGLVAGVAFGFALGWLLRRDQLVPEGLEDLVTLGGVLVLFAGCNQVLSESGILAVTVAGVVVGNERVADRVAADLRDFEERLTLALIGVLFILLAADVRVQDVRELGTAGVVSVLLLMGVVRPLGVALCTYRSGLDLREKLFVAWTGPRGIVAAAVASLAAVLLDAGGLGGGKELRALVFLTIAITVAVQGGLAPYVARFLGVLAPPRRAVAILGGEEMALVLGGVLGREEGEVVVLDSNPAHCRVAEERGFVAVCGNALDERTLRRARLDRCQLAIGLTSNEEVNSLFVREAREDFDVPETYIAVGREKRRVSDRILERQRTRPIFDGPKDLERWNVRFRHGLASVRAFRFEEPEARDAPTPEPRDEGADSFAILALERDGTRVPMASGVKPEAGQRAWVAIHHAEEADALRRLMAAGWHPAEEESAEADAADGALGEPA